MSEEKGKLVDFNKIKLTRKLVPINQKLHCKHKQLVADAETRTLECEHCGAIVDAFDYIYSVSLQEEGEWEKMECFQREVNFLKREKIKLEDEIMRLKAQKRRIA